MAKPDCRDGWIPYAHELDAALAAADFRKGARIVLREMFFQVFGIGPVGKTRLRPATLSPSDLAQRTGLPKREVVRSLQDLVRCRVLKRVDRGLYAFLKDYERWTWADGTPRLSKAELGWCAATRELAKARISASEGAQNLGVQTDPGKNLPGVQTDPAWGSKRTPLGGLNGPQESAAPPDPPYVNGRAELREERLENKTPLPPKGGDDDGVGVRLLDSPEDPKTLRSQRRTRVAPEQLEALVAWAKAVVGDRGELECYFSKLAGWASSYPIAWIETAILCTAAKSDIRAGGLAQYTNKCLTNWHPDGPPKDMARVAEKQRATGHAPEFTTAPPGFAEHIAGKKGTR